MMYESSMEKRERLMLGDLEKDGMGKQQGLHPRKRKPLRAAKKGVYAQRRKPGFHESETSRQSGALRGEG